MQSIGEPSLDFGTKCRFFILKLAAADVYNRARLKNVWATPIHSSQPQIHEILTEAFDSGNNVIFVVSVTGTRRYQAIARMVSRPGDSTVEKIVQSDENLFSEKQLGPPFGIEWIIQSSDATQEGLHFSKSNQLVNELSEDGCVNLSRNGQEIDFKCGSTLCGLIVSEINAQRAERERIDRRNARVPTSFFSLTEEEERQMIESTSRYWDIFLSQVKASIGSVLIATVIGSRRYNLQSESSDLDLFVISVYPLERFLQYPSPDQTYKNPENLRPDFTIYSVEYFCRLLLAGDTKVVECLFLHDSVVHFASPSLWASLVSQRALFLTKAVIETYIGEVKGSKGLKQMEKLAKLVEATSATEDDRVRFYKKWYIVLRCLIHAEHALARSNDFVAWFTEESDEKKYLMDVRHGKYDHQSLLEESQRKIESIEKLLKSSHLPSSPTAEASKFLQSWYNQVRQNELPQLDMLKSTIPSSEWSRISIPSPFQPPAGDLVFATTGTISPHSSYFGVFISPISTYLSLEFQAKRKNLSVTSGRNNTQGREKQMEYQFYELDSLIDAFIRGDLFAFVNLFIRKNSCEILHENPIFSEIFSNMEHLITSSLMLSASGWLTSGVAQKLKGKSPADLFSVIDTQTYQDVCAAYERCLIYSAQQAEEESVSSRLLRCRSMLDQVRNHCESLDSASAHLLMQELDKEISPIKPFTSILQPSPDASWLQGWSSKLRYSLCS